jgi:hypothetical protein
MQEFQKYRQIVEALREHNNKLAPHVLFRLNQSLELDLLLEKFEVLVVLLRLIIVPNKLWLSRKGFIQ